MKTTERLGFVAIACLLVMTGLVPAPLVGSRQHASEQLFVARITTGVLPADKDR